MLENIGAVTSVLPAGAIDPISDGRTDDLAQAESLSEAALRTYAENRLSGSRKKTKRSSANFA
jgi:hypothetical protein